MNRREALAMLGGFVASSAALVACGRGEATGDRPGTGRLPTAADLRAVEAEMGALPGVTGAALTYTPKNLGSSASWGGSVSTDLTDEAAMAELLRQTWLVVWNHATVATGLLTFVVKNPVTGVVADARDAGQTSSPGYSELLKLFGPRPT